MDILNIKQHKKLQERDRELQTAYSVMQLQKQEIAKLQEKVTHLEELLKFEAKILNFNKE